MYEAVLLLERKQNTKIDLVICCGDFQAVRNMTDLNSLSCPPKYRRINTFYKYYSGEKTAPVLTILIGGNHEASNHLTELYYGGWVAPNIYFLGMSGVVNFGGLRIGGLSGIFNQRHYHKGHYEIPPYRDDTMRSVYHVREFEVFKLMQLTGRIDVMLSHDWPRGIAYSGDKEKLLRIKRFLRQDIESGRLGSPPAEQLLNALQPEHWFAAHMHVKFPATVYHPNGRTTKFLALDKVMPNRQFLQMWTFPQATGPKQLNYDEEWLAIIRSTNHLLSFSPRDVQLPKPSTDPSQRFDYRPTTEELEWVRKRLHEKQGGFQVPENFIATAPVYHPGERSRQAGELFESPQRTAFLDFLELPDLFLSYAASLPSVQYTRTSASPSPYVPSPSFLPYPPSGFFLPPPSRPDMFPLPTSAKNEEEIELGLDDETGDEPAAGEAKRQKVEHQNEEEIDLGDL